MSINNIICLPDMLRGTRAFPEGFFDLVREPIRQGCNIQIGQPPESTTTPALGNFEIDEFRKLVGIDAENKDEVWRQTFFSLPSPALNYFHQHLPEDCLVLSFEMPPWLEAALNERSVPFIDIRVSPLRFGRDLYIALRSNDPSLNAHIATHQITAQELRLEAGYLAANVSMHQQRLVESDRPVPTLENAIVFIGQAPYDASLIRPGGQVMGFGDYQNRIRPLVQGRRLFHKPHPFARWFAEEECRALQEITGQEIQPCMLNAYQILASKEDVELIGLCSGLLQEAAWFDKKAYSLHPAFTPLSIEADDIAGYRQVHFHRWLSPGFWHALLTPENPAPLLLEVPPLAHHHARHTIDQWWDYLKVLTWEKAYSYESFERSGGALLRGRINTLEQAAIGASYHREMNETDEEWQAFKKHIVQEFSSQTQQFGRGLLYQGHEGWQLPGQRPTLHRLEKYGLNQWLSPQDSMLDIGCNIGLFGLTLSSRISSYQGFDANPTLIDIAKKIAHYKGINNCAFTSQTFTEFVQANPGKQFDKVLSFAVHVWIDQPLDQYAKSLWDLLKPNGILVIESNNLATNDKLFFPNMQVFIQQGFELLNQGMLKDDGIIERGFFLFRKPAS